MFAQTDSVKLLPPTEVIAQRLNQFSIGQTRLQSDSMTLQLFQNQHLADYLQSETPLSIRTYGTGLASVAVRGMAANHTAVLWNGINIQNPLNGLNDMALLDVSAVQRIDVKMGGNSALFGSGAIGGVIYLDNEQPRTEGVHGQLGYSLGSFGLQNQSGQLSVRKKKIGASIRLSHQAATNDFLFQNTADAGQPLQHATNAAFNLLNINANLFFELSPKDFFKINYWASDNFREITPTMTARNDSATYTDAANRGVAEWAHFFKNNAYLKMRSAYIFDKNIYNSDVIKNSQNNIRTYINEAELNVNFSQKHSFRAGINRTVDQSNNSNYTQNRQRNRFAFFINDVLKTDFITLTANLRQEWLDKMQPTTFAMGFEKNILANPNPRPQRGANQSPITNNQSLILRGSLSRNFNIPTFNDLYWAELGNPNLETEQGWSKELGLIFKNKINTSNFQAHLTVFDIDMKNRIVWQPQTDGKWRPTNAHQFNSRGIETWSSYQFSTSNLQYKINVNYQFAHATDGNGGVQLFVPKHNGSLSGWVKYRTVYASWQQTASSKRFGATDKTTWTKPFTLGDATVGFTPSVFFGLKADLRLQVLNVFNTDYQVIRFYPNPKRMFRLVGNLAF